MRGESLPPNKKASFSSAVPNLERHDGFDSLWNATQLDQPTSGDLAKLDLARTPTA